MSSPSTQPMAAKPTEPAAGLLGVSADVTQQITEEAFLALKSLPKRGAEIGGFLTASAEKWDGTLVFDRLHLVTSEHRFGPSYILSPGDVSNLREQVREKRIPGSAPLAYFRSCTRADLNVTDDDRKIVRQLPPGTRFLVMAKPFLNGNVLIGYFELIGTDVNEDTWSEFRELECTAVGFSGPRTAETAPLLPAPTSAAATSSLVRPLEQKPAVQSSLAVPNRVSMLERIGVRIPVRDAPVALIGLLLIALAIPAAFVIAARWRGVTAPPASGLDLRVERQHESLRVTWNHGAAAAGGNSTGVLDIEDGESHRVVLMDAAQVASGSVLYTPRSGDLTFHLEIRSPDRPNEEEFVRVLGAETASPTVAQLSPAVTKEKPASEEQANRSRIVNPPLPPPTAKTQPFESKSPVLQPKQAEAAPLTRDVTTPGAVAPLAGTEKRAIETRPIEKHPEATQQKLAVAKAPESAGPALPEVSTSDAVPSATIPGPQAPVTSPLQAEPTPPPVASPARSDETPAHPLRQVVPRLSSSVGPTLQFPIRVQIMVQVDEHGRVTKAQEVRSTPVRFVFLSGEALRAARQWTFTPASKKGKHIKSEYLVDFLFGPLKH